MKNGPCVLDSWGQLYLKTGKLRPIVKMFFIFSIILILNGPYDSQPQWSYTLLDSGTKFRMLSYHLKVIYKT